MQLFIGLGNPGAKYAHNRHNIGFMAVDAIANAHGFSPWRQKFNALISEGRLDQQKIILAKPQTFINKSGDAAQQILQFYKLNAPAVTIFHDELDLAPAKCRYKQGGGHAGHNGLRSLHAHIGSDYARVRLGIGHPGTKDAVAPYVLRDFSKADQAWLAPLLEGIAQGAPALATGDAGRFMNAVSLKVTPPRPSRQHQQKLDHKPQSCVATQPEARSPLQRLLDRFT